jgi:hypothetical protein
VPTEIIEQQAIEIEPDLSYIEERRLKCIRSCGTTILQKKPPGKLKIQKNFPEFLKNL